LERIRPDVVKSSDLCKQIDLYLGQAYQQMGQTDEEYAAYRRAILADPSLLPAHLGMAKALVSLGRIDEAVEVYRRMVPLAPGARLGVAQTLVMKQLTFPRARNWTEVDQALDEASRLKPEPPELAILRAEALAAQNKPGARDILEKAVLKDPKRVELWTALATLTDLEGKG